MKRGIFSYKRTLIMKWCKPDRLTLNETKTKHFYITNQKHHTLLEIDADGKYLGNVDTYDYLGLCLDKKLNMHAHIAKIIKIGQF